MMGRKKDLYDFDTTIDILFSIMADLYTLRHESLGILNKEIERLKSLIHKNI